MNDEELVITGNAWTDLVVLDELLEQRHELLEQMQRQTKATLGQQVKLGEILNGIAVIEHAYPVVALLN